MNITSSRHRNGQITLHSLVGPRIHSGGEGTCCYASVSKGCGGVRTAGLSMEKFSCLGCRMLRNCAQNSQLAAVWLHKHLFKYNSLKLVDVSGAVATHEWLDLSSRRGVACYATHERKVVIRKV